MAMLLATLLFALMSAGVKLAGSQYSAGEILMYRGLVGALLIMAVARVRREPLRTRVPAMHFWRSLSGVGALGLWFYSFTGLPLGTAVTLNYMSSVWLAVFLAASAWLSGGGSRTPRGLTMAVLAGFAGVALILQPTLGLDQLEFGLAGLLSGLIAASAYLQVGALGRAGEPESRVVFYFSLGSLIGGIPLSLAFGGFHAVDLRGALLLGGIGILATVAQLLLTRAYSSGQTLKNATLQYAGVAFSFVLGIWIFDDPVTFPAVAGMVLIAAAGAAATVLRQRRPVIDPGQRSTAADREH